MVFRLLKNKWKVVAYNHGVEKVAEVVKKGATGVTDIKDLVFKLSTPRVVWIMVSHQAVGEVIDELFPLLKKGDLIIDGGNSPYRESIECSKKLAKRGIGFLDIGVFGGPGGALNGSCVIVDGKKELYEKLEKDGFFADTCVERGYGYMGASGAGHFVKMVHNRI